MFYAAPPHTVSVGSVGATWVHISWETLFNVTLAIAYYETIARATNGVVRNTSTSTNMTFVNVTGLLPGTTYNFTVIAVVQSGDVTLKGPCRELSPCGCHNWIYW